MLIKKYLFRTWANSILANEPIVTFISCYLRFLGQESRHLQPGLCPADRHVQQQLPEDALREGYQDGWRHTKETPDAGGAI